MGSKEWQKEYERLQIKAIVSLKKLGEYIGMFGKHAVKPSYEVTAEMKYMLAVYYFFIARTRPQKYAIALILGWWMPEWREVVGVKCLGGIADRNSREVKQWRKEVLTRDNNTCQECGKTDQLEAHHIIEWAELEEHRTDVDNGITLCTLCHSKKHPYSDFILAKRKAKVS